MSFTGKYDSFYNGADIALDVTSSYDADHNASLTLFGLVEDDRLTGSVTLDQNDAISLAVGILTELDPDRLKPVPFVDLPNGTFLRRYLDGRIAQIIATPEGAPVRDLDDDANWASFEDGTNFIAVQRANSPAWAVLTDDQVEVKTKTTWEFKP